MASAKPTPTPKLKLYLCCAIIALAALAAYSNSFEAPFVYDDLTSIVQNQSIRHLWPLSIPLSPPQGDGWTVDRRPILNLSLALNYAISGTEVWSYHALNLLIHIIGGLALFGVARRALAAAKAEDHGLLLALAIALIWTLHPLQTEAVTYVVQRAESLMGMFYLLTLYGFVRYAERLSSFAEPTEDKKAGRWAWGIASVLACFFAMGVKEVAVTLPVMVLMYDRTFAAGTFRDAWRLRWRYYLCLAATWLFLFSLLPSGLNRANAKGFGTGVGWGAWMLTQFEALVYYLRMAIWPHPLIFSYGTFWVGFAEAAPYALVVTALGCATLWALASRRGKAAGFLGFWFFGILAVTSVVPGIGEMIVDRRMYLPLAAVVALLATAIHARAGRRGLAALFVLAAGFGAMTWMRNRTYRDAFTIWSDTVAKRPGNGIAQYNLGVAYFDRGEVAEEVAHYRTALSLNPDNFEAHHSLANELLHQGQLAEAARHFQAALVLRPDFASIHYDYGILLLREGDGDGAIAEYSEAIRLKPDYPEAQDNLGIVLAKSGRIPEAIAHFQAALKLDPRNPNIHHNLAVSLAAVGRGDEANAQFELAARLGGAQ